jgi:LysR family transcriptional activator of nhaA
MVRSLVVNDLQCAIPAIRHERNSMTTLNFHHLRYFWAVAKDGNLTRAARQLHVSQSALSVQIKQLESDLGQRLFQRTGRTLTLTESGQVALAYADSIFATGNELVEVLREGRREERQVLRIGAVATTSRNFQENFIRPLLDRDDVDLVLVSGSLPELLARLRVHSLDLVLCNQRIHASATEPWRCRRIAQQPVSLVGRPSTLPFKFPEDLAHVPLVLPGRDNELRLAFDLRCEQLGLRPRVRAEVASFASTTCSFASNFGSWMCFASAASIAAAGASRQFALGDLHALLARQLRDRVEHGADRRHLVVEQVHRHLRSAACRRGRSPSPGPS